jgi:hypothetical protein
MTSVATQLRNTTGATRETVCKVIAIAAPIGGGKSALTSSLAAALQTGKSGQIEILQFDDHEQATRQSVAELSAWLASGADFNQLKAPGFAEAIDAVQRRSDVSFLVLEMPLGRAWLPAAEKIDFLVWVEVPLDIALARRVKEIAGNLLQQDLPGSHRGLAWLEDYLAHYISTIHAVLEKQREVVKPAADMTVDGLNDIAGMVQQILGRLEPEVWP